MPSATAADRPVVYRASLLSLVLLGLVIAPAVDALGERASARLAAVSDWWTQVHPDLRTLRDVLASVPSAIGKRSGRHSVCRASEPEPGVRPVHEHGWVQRRPARVEQEGEETTSSRLGDARQR